MYYAIKFEDGRYLSFGTVLNRHDPVQAETYKVHKGDGTSKYEIEVRQRSADFVAKWFTQNLSDARIFDNVRSAQNAGRNGPYKFDIVEVEVFVREK